MIRVDEPRLESDLNYRFDYLAGFMGFTEADIAAIHAAGPLLAPKVPYLVDAVYAQLRKQDATWRHFLPPQEGYAGRLAGSLAELEPNHEVIEFRKKHLARYFTKLVTQPYDQKLVTYLDFVGRIHTPHAGSEQVNVPLVQMNALMGFVADALLTTVLELGFEPARERATLRAVNKLLWLQNDLINRHYQALPAASSRT